MVSPINEEMQVYCNIWDKENDVKDNVLCDVCLWEFDEPEDQLVMCEGCNGATHQTCYGANLVGLKSQELSKIDFFC